MNPNNDYHCYIRRAGEPWTRGRSHHHVAMENFLEREREGGRGQVYRIVVPHSLGGDFVGWFRRVNSIVCQYTDEYGREVDIMMCASSQAAFANRIVDHY